MSSSAVTVFAERPASRRFHLKLWQRAVVVGVFHFTILDDQQVIADAIRVSTSGGRYGFHAEGHYT